MKEIQDEMFGCEERGSGGPPDQHADPGSCGCVSHNSFLTAKGLEEAAQRRGASPEGLAVRETLREVDRVGSVSALVEPSEPIWVDSVIEEQDRRFHNGS